MLERTLLSVLCFPQILKAWAENWLSVFSSEEMRCLLQREDHQARAAVGFIAGAFLTGISEAGLLKMIEETSASLRPIIQSLEKAILWCQCICHLLSVMNHECKPQHVIYFLEYKGKGWFEKSLKQLLTKPKGFWPEMAQEVVRTASTATLLQPKKAQLEKELEAKNIFQNNDSAILQSHLQVFAELETGMRKSEISQISSNLFKALDAETNRILKMSNSCALSSSYIDTLVQGLNMFSSVPGALSLVNGLQDWMTTQKQGIAVADLFEVVSSNLESSEDVDFGEVKATVSKMKGSDLSDDCYQKVDAFLLKMLKQLLHQAPSLGGVGQRGLNNSQYMAFVVNG